MTDERFEFIEDCREKKHTARSARNKRGHAGKGGATRTPSDFMTKKQLRTLNGECKTYKLGAPMSWNEFSEMPDDLKAMYIKNLRKKFNVPDFELATAMDVDILAFTKCLNSIKVQSFMAPGSSATDDCGRFLTWWKISEDEKTQGM